MGGLRPLRKNSQPRLEEANDAKNVESTSVESSTKTLQREAWTARGKLLLKFHDAISRAINSPEMRQKCSEVASSMSAAEEEPEESSSLANHEYDAEATLIVQNKHKRDNDVRDKAVAVGLCTFLLLRGVPTVRNIVARRMASASKYKFESASPHQQLSGSSTTLQQSVQQPARESPSRLRKFIRLTLDITISAAMTVLSGTFLFTPRPSAYIEDMSKLPLVEGKSVYAEVVCPPLLNEYKRAMEQYGGRWPVMMASPSSSSSATAAVATAANSPTLTQEDVSLNIIRKFAENCSKRIKYERAILEEQNALDDELKKKIKLGTVLIPRPVPEDVKVNIDEDVFFLIDDDDAAKDGKACIE
eukprot:CAMPEP_0201694368 /NCGR_PEP_ID=MMETSP0578-20130828/6671_1 /ASSEMBLY_ACC=CAM_ASM_000663 /TAXON_ID=267565 /ORGANISM="Skeletonema grethea, Strain CCMP 1804" /LENGTH=359 /DNA_ID=CAMNT_0048180047 /DNA_START=68 /DNA_END=1147 /DNA_ORIENTATION=-